MKAIARLLAVSIKEVRQLSRDRISLGMIVGIPVMQILLFGFAINLDVRHLEGAVLDYTDSHASRLVVARAAQSQVIDIVQHAESTTEMEALLRRGDIQVGLYIPQNFDRRLERGETAAQLWVDGSDPQILSASRGLASMPNPVSGSSGPAWMETRAFYNPERRTAAFIVPRLLGVVLTMTMIMFTAMAIVRERERGNLEFLITTPISSAELMVGKIVPYVVIGLVQFSLILLIGWTVFDVPVVGSIWQLYIAALVFIAASLSLGLLISTKAENQFQSMQLTFFVFLPSILLSGFMFPFQGMPRVVQWIAEILPLTHFLRIVRGILLRGAELSELLSEIWWLLGFFVVAMAIAALRFNKRLD